MLCTLFCYNISREAYNYACNEYNYDELLKSGKKEMKSLLLLIAIIIFEAFSLAYIKIFLDQRAVLDIGRAIGCDIRDLIQMESYKSHAFIKYGRWVILAGIFYLFGWKYAVGLFIIETVLSAVMPVPLKSYREAIYIFRVVSKGDPGLMQLYDKAEYFLRSNGILF